MKKISFYTLGCKVNQVETEQMIEEFLGRGYQLAEFGDPVDVCVINTCTVTHISDRKSRAAIRRAIRTNPAALVVATGCLAQIDAQGINDMEGVGLVIGNQAKEQTAEIVETYLSGQVPGQSVWLQPPDLEPGLRRFLYTIPHKRTRAFVKIQDGCQSFCSYCVVPHARGPVRSKKPDDVVAELAQLQALGYKEVVLTGIHTGQYGRELQGWDVTLLLDYILGRVAGDYRIRLSSLEPLEVNARLLAMMAAQPRICRHLHIPLQSGSNRVLNLMGRRYTRDYYRQLVLEAAALIPSAAFTADVMVGFPQETDDDFHDTFNLIEELPMYDLHVFKYSQRAGTSAADMAGQVEATAKQQRSQALLDLAGRKKKEFIVAQVGQTVPVLTQKILPDGICMGLSDNYLEVRFPGRNDTVGHIMTVTIDEACSDFAVGHITV
ncbi:MAG: tRNA (N(6)-L-threonylcarbamoyladenosine(37)-C(2))-methylthiotransferase MtaB [Syntrophomonadaceae bacterium]|nr:tRNA (N(6)-L-threonylcarbamoyladenosine(37)-C(2))-methylthiotransferase MtaB [Syntrophomonadaceae bacterium]